MFIWCANHLVWVDILKSLNNNSRNNRENDGNNNTASSFDKSTEEKRTPINNLTVMFKRLNWTDIKLKWGYGTGILCCHGD